VGATSLANIEKWATDHDSQLWTAIIDQEVQHGLPKKASSALKAFASAITDAQEISEAGPVTPVLRSLLTGSGSVDMLKAEHSQEALGRLENLQELLNVTSEYDATADEPTLGGFLESVSLVADVDSLTTDGDAVTLMTLHSAKGLEFPVVFMAGMEEGVFPHSRSLNTDSEVEEERRLCYVGLTRAMRHLILTHAWSRTMWGQHADAVPSRFLQEIPSELVHDLSTSLPTRRSSFSRDEDGFVGRGTDFTSGKAFGAGTAPPVRSTGAENLGLVVGDRVVHDRYGPGVVAKVDGSGAHARATVNFKDYGTKQLVLAMTPLRRA
jgi:DNA helicase-2/ATP-dependent DNA helicase PcrA